MNVMRRAKGDFYANFKGAEIREETSFLRSSYGDGTTPEKAIRAYSSEISGHLLIVDAYKETRREIKVPQLLEQKGGKS